MSCYLRHLKGIMQQAGVEPTHKEERKAVDLAVREIVGTGPGPCNEVWKTIKLWLSEPGRDQILVAELQKRITKQ